MDVFCIDSVDIDSIECIRDLCLVLTVLTYIAFDGMVEKPSVSFRNAWMCFVSTVIHALILCLNSVDIHNIQCISHFDPLS